MNDTKRPLVTIAIPTYNRADGQLVEAIESALGQSYERTEIIVSDNCSTDNTEEIVRGYDDPRIRYYRQKENIGANGNTNFCVAEATGDYFLLLHDDDRIDPDMVEACLRACDFRTGVGVIRTGTRFMDGEGRVTGEARNMMKGTTCLDFLRDWFSEKTQPYLCSSLFSTADLKKIGGFGSRHNLLDDVVADVRMIERAGSVQVEEIKASFRRHDGSRTSASEVVGWCEDSFYLLGVIGKVTLGDHRDEILREARKLLVGINYRRAASVPGVRRRLRAYLQVFRLFGYRHLPPRSQVQDHLRLAARKLFGGSSSRREAESRFRRV